MRQKRSTVNALAGTQRGDLTILRIDHLEPRTGNIWLCRCKCGKEVLLPTSRIMSGRSYSCPECGKRKNIERAAGVWRQTIYKWRKAGVMEEKIRKRLPHGYTGRTVLIKGQQVTLYEE